MPTFVHWTQHLLSKKNRHQIANGILYLKGGDLEEELSSYPESQIYELTDWIPEEEFQTKKLVYLPL
jgi:16S rRNA (guanine527-N7)-methyltransferase